MMFRLVHIVLFTFVLLTGQAVGASRIADSTREVVLDNGMRLLLVQRPGQPNIAAGWVAHVGSANERPGITGISHLFEHMMFKGSPRIGTHDNALDRQLRAQLDALRDRMFAEERKYREQVRLGQAATIADPELQTEQMVELRAQFNALIARQRENIVKDQYDRIYTDAGATAINAFTNQDMTVYFLRVPKNKLELWFWMESERLAQPVFREFYSERDVVYEERRLRTDSTPTGAQDEVFEALLWRGHPYGWPVVGWPSDIAAITRSQAEEYFHLYYAPNNITMALVGDFDETEAIAWAQQYLGVIPAAKNAPPDVITLAMPQHGELVYRAEVDAPPSAQVVWRTTAFAGRDDPALAVLESILSGKTGRLYKRLVLEEKLATTVSASASGGKYDGSFNVSAVGKQGVEPDRLRDVLLEEVALVRNEGVSEYELEKVKNQLSASEFRRLQDPFFLMIQLLFFDGLRDWRSMDTYSERLLLVQANDIRDVANKYLNADGRAVKLYARKASDAPQDPALAAFEESDRQRIQRMLSQFGAMPTERLPEMIENLTNMKTQAPPEAGAAIDYVIAKLRERLES